MKLMVNKRFTLIELIAVIIILAILVIVALPRYRELNQKAAKTTADGVFGAATKAATINFANGVLKTESHTAIVTGNDLLNALDDAPEQWKADGNTIIYKIEGQSFAILIQQAETITNQAKLTKSWQ